MAVLNPEALEYAPESTLHSSPFPPPSLLTYDWQPTQQPIFPYQSTYYSIYQSPCFSQHPYFIDNHAIATGFYHPNFLPVSPPTLSYTSPSSPPLHATTYPSEEAAEVKEVVSEKIVSRNKGFMRKSVSGWWRTNSWKEGCEVVKNYKKKKVGRKAQKAEVVFDGIGDNSFHFGGNKKIGYPKQDFQSEPILPDGFKTTIMIRNIPNKLKKVRNIKSWKFMHTGSQNLNIQYPMYLDPNCYLLGSVSGANFMEFLDQHCLNHNKKSEWESSDDESFESAYDFFYLPIDFRSNCNKGYAFVNFTDPRAVWKFHESLNNYKWEIFRSRKICEITYARIQGKKALIDHFEKSTFECRTDDYLPTHFIPPRDGSGKPVQLITVGNRCTTFLSKFTIMSPNQAQEEEEMANLITSLSSKLI